jgi:hypothetical protein
MAVVVGIAMIGAVAIAALPRHSPLLRPALSLREEEMGHA